MKQASRSLLRGTVLAWLAMGVLAFGGRAAAEEFLPTALTPASPDAVQAIQKAGDPSSAVQAFAEGIAQNGKNVSLYKTYVSKMVSFGLPGMAYSQAQFAVDADSRFGLGWAVLAYGDSRQDRMTAALSEIVRAGRDAAAEPFVQATAGQLLAWVDNTPDKPALDATLQADLARLRADLKDQAAFREAYQAADKNYRELAREPLPPQVSAPSENAQEPPATSEGTYAYEGAVPLYDWGYYNPGFYAQPWPYYWWQPTFWPSPVFLSFGHHHRPFWIGGGRWGWQGADRSGSVWTHNHSALFSSSRALLNPPNSVIVPARGLATAARPFGAVSVSPRNTARTNQPMGTLTGQAPAASGRLTSPSISNRFASAASPRVGTPNSLPPLRVVPRSTAAPNRTFGMEGPKAPAVAPRPFFGTPSGTTFGPTTVSPRYPPAPTPPARFTGGPVAPARSYNGGHVTGGNMTHGYVTGGYVTGGNVTHGFVTGGNMTQGNVMGHSGR